MALQRIRSGDVLYAIIHNARVDYARQVASILEEAASIIRDKAVEGGYYELAGEIEALLRDLRSKIARLRYVKDGDYVLAEDHNTLVDALIAADNVARVLYGIAKQIVVPRLPNKIVYGPAKEVYGAATVAGLAETGSEHILAVESTFEFATAGTKGSTIALKSIATAFRARAGTFRTILERLLQDKYIKLATPWLFATVEIKYTTVIPYLDLLAALKFIRETSPAVAIPDTLALETDYIMATDVEETVSAVTVVARKATGAHNVKVCFPREVQSATRTREAREILGAAFTPNRYVELGTVKWSARMHTLADSVTGEVNLLATEATFELPNLGVAGSAVAAKKSGHYSMKAYSVPGPRVLDRLIHEGRMAVGPAARVTEITKKTKLVTW